MVKKGKSSLRVENRRLIAKYIWKGVNKVLNTSIFKTSFKGKTGDKERPVVKKTYGMLLESAGNCTIKIGKSFPEHYLQQDFINKIRGKYDRIIQEEKKKIKDEVKKYQRIQQIKKEKNYVIKKLERTELKGKINNLNNWLDRKCPGKKFIETEGKDYRLLIYRVVGPKDKIKLFCSKYYQPAFRNFIKIETSVKEEINLRFDKVHHIQKIEEILNKTCTENLEKEHKEYDEGFKKFSWLPIIENWDSHRSLIPEIKKNLKDGYSVLILGESGSGKSNLLKRVAYDMHNDGWDVFEPVSGKDINEIFNQLIESDKSLLVIDDVYNRINEIDELLTMNAKYREKIGILCAERTERWFKKGKAPLGELELKDKRCLIKYLNLTEEDVKNYFKKKHLKPSKINENTKIFMREHAGKPGEFLMLLLFSGTQGGKDLIQNKIESIKNSINSEEEELLRKIFVIRSYEGAYPLNILPKLYGDIGILHERISSLKNKGLISIYSNIETYHPFICNSYLQKEMKENNLMKEIIKRDLIDYIETIDLKTENVDMLHTTALNIGLEDREELLPISLRYLDKIINIDGVDKNRKAMILYNKAVILETFPKGIRYQNKQYIRKAIDCYDEVLGIEPKNALALFNKGVSLANLKKHKEAIDFYDKVLEINPNDEKALVNKGIALEYLPDGIKYKNKTYIKKAIASYNKALEINPKNVDGLFNKGVALVKLKQYKNALKYFSKVLDIKPDNYRGWHIKGASLGGLEEYDEAFDCFIKALELKPDYSKTIIAIGSLLRAISPDQIDNYHEKFEKALVVLDVFLKKNKNLAEAWFSKAIILFDLQRYEPAIACYNKALELQPEDIVTWLDEGLALEKLGRYQESIDCYDKVIEINPQHALAYYRKGIATEYLPDGIRYKNKTYVKKAKACYIKTLKIDPKNEKAHYNLGFCYIYLDDYENAVSSSGHAAFLSYKKHSKEEFTEKYFEKTFSMNKFSEKNICYECGIALAAIYCLEGKIYDEIISVCEKHRDNTCSSAKVVFDFLVFNKKSKIENIQNEKDFTFKDLMDKIMKYYSS